MRLAHIKRARECTYFTRDFLVPSLRAGFAGHKGIYNPLSAVAKAGFCSIATVIDSTRDLRGETKECPSATRLNYALAARRGKSYNLFSGLQAFSLLTWEAGGVSKGGIGSCNETHDVLASMGSPIRANLLHATCISNGCALR